MNRRELIQLSPEEQQQYLQQAKTIILCTVGRDGYPHAVAMWFLADEDGTILMTTFARSQKVLNIRRNPKVTLLVESGHTYEALKGLMIRGRAELVESVDDCAKLLLRIHKKSGGEIQEGLEDILKAQARKRILIKVHPERVSSWDHAKLGGVY